MPNEGNGGMAKLAAVVDQRIEEHQPTSLIVDFGEILPEYQLKTNTFPRLIPAKDYMVCRQLTLGDTGGFLTNVTTSEGNGQAYIPEKMRKLQPGDRVVVAWVQKTAVVLDIMVKASSL